MQAVSTATHVYDIVRSMALFASIVLTLLALWQVLNAYRFNFPVRYRLSGMLDWIGRTLLHFFCCIFVFHRLGHSDFNWYTPVLLTGQIALLTSVWIRRSADDEEHDGDGQHGSEE